MADDAPEKDSKTQEPSAQKLAQARAEGQVAKSPEVASYFALAAASAILLLNSGSMSRQIADSLLPFIAHPDAIDLSGQGGMEVLRAALKAASPAAIILCAATVAGVVGNVVQHGFLFTPGKLAPDFSRLSPMKGLSRLFGADALVNFGKTFLKFLIMCTVIWFQLQPQAKLFQGLAALDPVAILPFTMDILRAVIIAALVMLAISAALDWVIMRQRFMAQMRMTRQEQKQEQKDSDGDPQIKAKLRQIRQAQARKRIAQTVPKATLIITNPTHFAVALRYVQGETAAPICVAKGVDDLAFRIRDLAKTLAIPVIEDPPLARALYATVEIDDTIPKEHYAAVAKIVGFILGAAKRRARPMRPPSRPRLN